MCEGSPPNIIPVTSALGQVKSAPNRLLLLVGPSGSGKTRLLMALEAAHGYPRVALGNPVADELRAVPERRRPTKVRDVVARLLDEAGSAEAVLVDNIEILFLPALRTDPMALFKDFSRNRTLCVAWPGVLEADGSLHYAELGHPAYQLYRDHKVHAIRMPGTG